jgi:hypothetical protein
MGGEGARTGIESRRCEESAFSGDDSRTSGKDGLSSGVVGGRRRGDKSGEPGLVDDREWEVTDASLVSRQDGHNQFLKCSFIYT